MVIFNSQGGSNSKHHPAHLARRIVGWLHPIAYVLQPQAPQHGHLRKIHQGFQGKMLGETVSFTEKILEFISFEETKVGI